MIDITFSINRYDEDGDICRAGIYLHFGETSVRVSDISMAYTAIQ